MTATVKKEEYVTLNGKTFHIVPGSETDKTPEEHERELAEWHARNRHLLAGYSSDQFVAEKRQAVREGRE